MGQDRINKAFSRMDVATLGGGCFWCPEAVFSAIRGVVKVMPGYSGGRVANPTYEQVSTGTTGHAEVVHIIYDTSMISFGEILEIFFAAHDPTTPNRQGADVGTQYRSVIFYHTDQQKTTSVKYIEHLNNVGTFGAPIVTRVEPFTAFYEAEEDHKDYFKRHSEEPYCKLVIAPKLAKLRDQSNKRRTR
jgi:peptide-methionine (S)-S-oxide reductase